MANYTYKCTNITCDEVFDVEFNIGQIKPLVYCPICKSPAKRFIGKHIPFVKYNGGGWGAGKGDQRIA